MTLMLFLWWVFVVGCVVWVAGIVWLFVLMARDALKGDDIGLYEVLKTFAWPVIFAWTAILVLLIASDDSLG